MTMLKKEYGFGQQAKVVGGDVQNKPSSSKVFPVGSNNREDLQKNGGSKGTSRRNLWSDS